MNPEDLKVENPYKEINPEWEQYKADVSDLELLTKKAIYRYQNSNDDEKKAMYDEFKKIGLGKWFFNEVIKNDDCYIQKRYR